jgi:hypothetical protein
LTKASAAKRWLDQPCARLSDGVALAEAPVLSTVFHSRPEAAVTHGGRFDRAGQLRRYIAGPAVRYCAGVV